MALKTENYSKVLVEARIFTPKKVDLIIENVDNLDDAEVKAVEILHQQYPKGEVVIDDSRPYLDD